MKRFIIVLLAALFSGCASVPLNDKGRKVRMVKATPHSCAYVGQFEGTPQGGIVNDLDEGYVEILHNDLKNRVGENGGDTVEIIRAEHLRVVGEAYRCGDLSRLPATP